MPTNPTELDYIRQLSKMRRQLQEANTKIDQLKKENERLELRQGEYVESIMKIQEELEGRARQFRCYPCRE